MISTENPRSANLTSSKNSTPSPRFSILTPRAYQWFGTMSVAPNGRIDAIWNDTRNDTTNAFSELFYSFSTDGGDSWRTNQAVSIPFDHTLGYPMQNKMGDYFDMISDRNGAHVSYSATFNGGQDVYYLRLLAVPEPSSIALLAFTVLGLSVRRRRICPVRFS